MTGKITVAVTGKMKDLTAGLTGYGKIMRKKIASAGQTLCTLNLFVKAKALKFMSALP